MKNYELNKIKFGLKSEDKKNMNQEQEKLYKEAEINLQQFSAPSGAEISKYMPCNQKNDYICNP